MTRHLLATLVVVLTLTLTPAALAAEAPTPSIAGRYVEIRSADVYTGPCFANGEMGLTGEEAILTWSIERGSFAGADLAGLSVIAVVKASRTLGDPDHSPLPAKALLIVDQRADPAQHKALADFARQMGGELTTDIVRVDSSPIHVTLNDDPAAAADHSAHAHHPGHHALAADGTASVHAPGLIDIQTRSLLTTDHVCGNESLYYPPLTDVTQARGAYTLVGEFSGQGLGVTFDEGGRRSAYLASFAY